MYRKGEIVRDYYGQLVEVVSDTNIKTGFTTVKKHKHWSNWEYPTILPKKGKK